jgi:hypothetical protein
MRISKLKLPYRAVFGFFELYAVFKVFVRSWLLKQDFGFQGYYEDKLVSKFSKTVGLRYSDAVNSGSAAIWISLKSIGLQNADEVIVSPITNPGSVMPVSLIGAFIRVADSEPGCFNMSLGSVQKLINHRTKCIIVTHLALSKIVHKLTAHVFMVDLWVRLVIFQFGLLCFRSYLQLEDVAASSQHQAMNSIAIFVLTPIVASILKMQTLMGETLISISTHHLTLINQNQAVPLASPC